MALTGRAVFTPTTITAAPMDGLPVIPPARPRPRRGHVVPGVGMVSGAIDRSVLAGYILIVHRPDQRMVELRKRWPILRVLPRACRWCRDTWPCRPTTWARAVPRSGR